MLRFKKDVRLYGIRPELLIAIQVVNEVCRYFDKDCQINSVNDGRHGESSLHYSGCAFDLDTHDGQGATRHCKFPISGDDLAEQIAALLPPDFDVIFEDGKDNEHIHIEYQPKRSYR